MTRHDSPNPDPDDAARYVGGLDQSQTRSFAALMTRLRVAVVISGPTGQTRHCNRFAQELLGWRESGPAAELPVAARADEDVGWPVVHEDGTPFSPDTQPLPVALATGRAVHNIVMGIYHPGRRQRVWVLVSSDPHLDDAGTITQVITTYNDITERRGFEARLALADRLTSMGTLASGIAHEINNPLAYITANLAYADEELADPATLTSPGRLTEIRHAILEARDGADRVRDIVADMRTLARGDAARSPRVPVDITRVLESAAGAIGSEIRRRAGFIKDLRDAPPIAGDEARLGQVFINLLLNAADAIPEGDPSRHQVTLSTAVDASGWVVVEVRDTGAGIAPELHRQIFDPFFTNKPVGRGIGLGLAICHHVVTDLGGTISVESAPERGSVFRVRLPAASAPLVL
ncbi:MAG: ATP-binding protein [Polyangia bacterium]